MAGATAATAAGVTTSQAGTITINLLNNYISALGGNHLNADVTGDGQPDLTLTNATYRKTYVYTRTSPSGGTERHLDWFVAANLNGVHASAFRSFINGGYRLALGSQYTIITSSSLTGSIPISFKDLHINNGAITKASLQITVSGFGNGKIQLDSFTYNAVADQGSSHALLAMGAGGVLALRRSRATQKRA